MTVARTSGTIAGLNIGHIPQFGGTIYYIDGTNGSDSNSGLEPTSAFATIGKGLTEASSGDALNIRQGTYTETGLDVGSGGTKDGIELWIEIGVIIAPASGVALTISGDFCKVWSPGGSLRVDPTAATGVLVSGNFNYLHDVRVRANSSGTLGYDVTGTGCVLDNCRCADPTVAAFKIQGSKTKLSDCCTGGNTTSIGFWITNSCTKFRARVSGSQGHQTAGWQVDSGVEDAVIFSCYSGGGDGRVIDNGTRTLWAMFDGTSAREAHEHVWPRSDGEGTTTGPVNVTNEAQDETGNQDDRYYWGEPTMVVTPTDIAQLWDWLGYNIAGNTISTVLQGAFYRVGYASLAARNAGNAWDEGATVLTVDDASPFLVDDLVLIRTPGYKPNGEVQKITNIAGNVITVARETVASGRTGLRWDHTTNDGGNEEMYLIRRPSDWGFHATDFNYSADTARAFSEIHFSEHRELQSNDGLIVRMMNVSDDGSDNFDLSILYREA